LRLQAADRPLANPPEGESTTGAAPTLLDFHSPSASLHCRGIAVLLRRSLLTLQLDGALTRHRGATCQPREPGSRGLPSPAFRASRPCGLGARSTHGVVSPSEPDHLQATASLRCSVCGASLEVLRPFSVRGAGDPLNPGRCCPGTVRLQVFSTSWRLTPSRSLRPCFMPVTLLGFVPSELSPHAKP